MQLLRTMCYEEVQTYADANCRDPQGWIREDGDGIRLRDAQLGRSWGQRHRIEVGEGADTERKC